MDPCETEEYQKFVESMVPHCRCEFDRPCDGVLAGGLCDQKKEPERHDEYYDLWVDGED